MFDSDYHHKGMEILSRYENALKTCDMEALKSCLRYLADVNLSTDFYERWNAHRDFCYTLRSLVPPEDLKKLDRLFWRAVLIKTWWSGAVWMFWGGCCAVGFSNVDNLFFRG